MKTRIAPAETLRRSLIALIIVAIAGIGGLLYMGYQQVTQEAQLTAERYADAEASSQRIGQLRDLQALLIQSDALLKKPGSLYAPVRSYQSVALRDINRYASAARVSVDNIEFPSSGASATDRRVIEVQLDSPVSYARLIHFLQLIENGVPLMQPTTVTVIRPTSPNGDRVTVQTIILEIGVR